MALLTVTINDAVPAFASKSSEAQFVARALEHVITELSAKRGQRASGSIIGISPAGAATTSLGSWNLNSVAGNP